MENAKEITSYDINKYADLAARYSADPLAYLDQYLVKRYLLDSDEARSEDFYLYQSPNKLCVLGLAPTHPILRKDGTARLYRIEFDERVLGAIKDKKRPPLQIVSKICTITTVEDVVGVSDNGNTADRERTTATRKHIVRVGLHGWVTEFNQRIVEEEGLLLRKPFTEGHIAILRPKHEDSEKALGHCVSEAEYKRQRNLQ